MSGAATASQHISTVVDANLPPPPPALVYWPFGGGDEGFDAGVERRNLSILWERMVILYILCTATYILLFIARDVERARWGPGNILGENNVNENFWGKILRNRYKTQSGPLNLSRVR